jgi:hypothetical protein
MSWSTATVQHSDEVEYVVEPEAPEYHESMTITDEQFEMVTNIHHETGIDDEDDDAS